MSSAPCPPPPCEGNAFSNLSKRLQKACPAYPGPKGCASDGAPDARETPVSDEAPIGGESDAQGSEQVGADIDISNKDNHVTRTVLARIITSPARAYADPASATWTMPLSHHVHLKNKQSDDLARTVLLDVVVKNVRSTAPLTLALKIPGVDGTILIPGGKTPLLVHPHANTAMARSIYTPDERVYSKQMQQYAGISEEALRSDLLPKPKEDFTYVPIGSPIADIVIKNQRLLDVKLDERFVYDQQLKVDNDLVEKCIQKLLSIVDTMPFTKLDAFSVSVVRADGEPFDSATNLESIGPNGVVKHSLRTDPFVVEVELDLKYVIVAVS